MSAVVRGIGVGFVPAPLHPVHIQSNMITGFFPVAFCACFLINGIGVTVHSVSKEPYNVTESVVPPVVFYPLIVCVTNFKMFVLMGGGVTCYSPGAGCGFFLFVFFFFLCSSPLSPPTHPVITQQVSLAHLQYKPEESWVVSATRQLAVCQSNVCGFFWTILVHRLC